MFRVGVAAYRPIIDGVLEYKKSIRSGEWSISYVDLCANYDINVIKALEIDGFIGVFDCQKQVDELSELGIVVVNVGTCDLDGARQVCLDEAKIGEKAAEYFLEQKSSNIYIAGHPQMFKTSKRLLSFRKNLESHEASVGEINCLPVNRGIIIEGSPYDPNSISKRLTDLKLPASVLAHNDCIAFDLLEACRLCGYKVPDDVAILGVDNSALYCNMATPELSSVDPNFYQNGIVAAKVLDQIMRGKQAPAKVLIDPKGVVERESTNRRFLDYPVVRQALRFINSKVTKGINVDDVVKAVSLSRRPLEVQFKSACGKTILESINDARVSNAMMLLKKSEWTIDQIAYASGFPNPKSMQEQFKKKTGMTAASFRLK